MLLEIIGGITFIGIIKTFTSFMDSKPSRRNDEGDFYRVQMIMNRLDRIEDIINSKWNFVIILLFFIVAAICMYFVWVLSAKYSRFQNSIDRLQQNLSDGGTPHNENRAIHHRHMADETEGNPMQSQALTDQSWRLQFSSMLMITKLKRQEGETFTKFLIRLRGRADNLGHDGRLSVEMREQAVEQALRNNLPEGCLPFTSTNMTSNQLVAVAEEYLNHQLSSGLQDQNVRQEVERGCAPFSKSPTQFSPARANFASGFPTFTSYEGNGREPKNDRKRYCQICKSYQHWTLNCSSITNKVGKLHYHDLKNSTKDTQNHQGSQKDKRKELTVIICYNCGQPGHKRQQCPKPSKNVSIRCYQCGDQGHIARECPR